MPSPRDLAASARLVGQLQLACRQRERERQNRLIAQLADLRAPLGQQWRALANIALGNGENRLARRAIDLFVAQQGNSPSARYLKAALLEQAGALEDAYALVCSLPDDVPDPAGHAFSRGTAALYLGETGEARRQLERATRLQPQHGGAWLSLAMACDLARNPEIAERILAAGETMGQAPPAQQAPYWFAHGRAQEVLGQHGAAFAAYARGGAIMRQLAPFDRAASERNARESLEGFTPHSIRELASRQTEPTGRAIFVTGLPRTGTSLVEQILTAHSAVSDGGEINRLPVLVGDMRGQSFAAIAAHAQQAGSPALARLWDHLLEERFPGSARIVDKTLNTTRLLGLVATILPEAPLVWMTRDPLDCAWSCFRTFFPASLPWTYDLEDIAFQFRLEHALLARWQDILGDRLLVVPHEGLVADPQGWIRAILAHCGLAEEPQVFAPHENARLVRTASVAQVRRPINRDGVGSAAPYADFLQPFTRAFAPGQAARSL